MRSLLKLAALYDPLRAARDELGLTLSKLGWPVNRGEEVADRLVVDFAMVESFCAFELVEAEHLLPKGHPDASDVHAMAPPARGKDGVLLPAQRSPFPATPQPWHNPVRDLFFSKAAAERHASIRAKGWALVALPLPLWQAARASHDQHYARRDVLLSYTMPLLPVETRPVSTGAVASLGKVRGAGGEVLSAKDHEEGEAALKSDRRKAVLRVQRKGKLSAADRRKMVERERGEAGAVAGVEMSGSDVEEEAAAEVKA